MAHDKAAIGGILDLLDRLGDGSCTTELSEELQQVVERVAEHGGKGTVTISLTVERVADRAVEVDYKLAAKSPRPEHVPTRVWLGEHGLTTRNPRQAALPFADDDVADAPRKIADIETARKRSKDGN